MAVRLVPPDAATPAAAPAAAEVDRNDHRMIRLVLAYGLFGFGYVITATFISTIAARRRRCRLSSRWSGSWSASPAIPSVGLWVAIGRRLGNDASYALASLTQAIAVALSVLVANASALLAAALLLGGTIMGLTALGLIQARKLARGDPRQSLALMTAAFGLGQMIGPSFAGYAYALTGSFRAPSLAPPPRW